MMSYPDALAQVKASKVPWPVVVMHLKNGIDNAHTCGECLALATMHSGNGYRYCWRAYSVATVPAETPACGKFRALDSSPEPEPIACILAHPHPGPHKAP